jgi:hypothetical protein
MIGFARFLWVAALPLGLVAGAAQAEKAMSGVEFEAYVTGKTITWNYGAGVLGTEQYLPQRQVRWAFEGDQCLNGTWFEDSGSVCFVYDNNEGPICWHFVKGAKGLTSQIAGQPDGLVIFEVAHTADPLACTGPEVGVSFRP